MQPRRTCLLFILLLFFLVPVAQNKPSFVALRGGLSLPAGGYRSHDLAGGSFAVAGFNVTLEGAWFFMPWLGVGGSAGLNFHPVDAASLATETLRHDPFMNSLTVRSDAYRVITFMAGPFVQYDLKGDFSLTGRLLGGAIEAETPYQLYKTDYFMIGPYWYEITRARDWEPSFMAGAGVKYRVMSCLALTLNADFTYNRCEFGFYTYNGLETVHHRIVFVNTTLGISIEL